MQRWDFISPLMGLIFNCTRRVTVYSIARSGTCWDLSDVHTHGHFHRADQWWKPNYHVSKCGTTPGIHKRIRSGLGGKHRREAAENSYCQLKNGVELMNSGKWWWHERKECAWVYPSAPFFVSILLVTCLPVFIRWFLLWQDKYQPYFRYYKNVFSSTRVDDLFCTLFVQQVLSVVILAILFFEILLKNQNLPYPSTDCSVALPSTVQSSHTAWETA